MYVDCNQRSFLIPLGEYLCIFANEFSSTFYSFRALVFVCACTIRLQCKKMKVVKCSVMYVRARARLVQNNDFIFRVRTMCELLAAVAVAAIDHFCDAPKMRL